MASVAIYYTALFIRVRGGEQATAPIFEALLDFRALKNGSSQVVQHPLIRYAVFQV
jgi:hypothetical protein